MDWFINELSLDGQYGKMDDFINDGADLLRTLDLVERVGGKLVKHSELYNRKITETETLYSLGGIKGNDQVTRLKSKLLRLSSSPPFWDLVSQPDGAVFWLGKRDVTDTSVSKAAQEQSSLISFRHETFADRILQVSREGTSHREGTLYCVDSVHTTGYLAQKLFADKRLERFEYLKTSFMGTRVDVTQLEPQFGCSILEMDEFGDVVSALTRLAEHKDWTAILGDRSLTYKAYTPKSKKVDWFASSRYDGWQIDKFRAGNTRVHPLRCFGYRQGDNFVLLRIERDHGVSDDG